MYQNQKENNANIIMAISLSVLVIFLWSWFVEKPKIEAQEKLKQEEIASQKNGKKQAVISEAKNDLEIGESKKLLALKDRKEVLTKSKNLRIKIKSDSLHGSISLKGARFDDLTLARYFTEPKSNEEVVLFAPANSKKRYFADFGWVSSSNKIDLPNKNTIWRSSSKILTPEKPITLSWKNRQNVKFIIKIALDENYMFNIDQIVKNYSSKNISIAPYGRINRVLNNQKKSYYILHEGPIGVFNDILNEVSYEDLADDKEANFESVNSGWLGITDKYWLSSIIPDKSFNYNANFKYSFNNQNNIYNSEFIGQEFEVEKGDDLRFSHHLFAGAKNIKLLDQYEKEYNITLFERAVDFGWFYFLTRPFLSIIDFLYKFLGNFGLAILVMTVLIKGALFPMANKSYMAIAKMKKLQPRIEKIKEKCDGDKIAINREMMALYKEEKINPASGCLPILIQIPVFFALYKVLFVTLDMRHAPFYGWIHDLSAPDPTSFFNLFGLLPYEVSGPFAIGIWPILMGLTMVLQQKLSPASSDPTQAKILKWMPYVLTFVLAAFPAGLVIYWTWSNSLSILQQWLITKKLNHDK